MRVQMCAVAVALWAAVAMGQDTSRPFPRGYDYFPPGELIGEFIAFPKVVEPLGGKGSPEVRAGRILKEAKKLERSKPPMAICLYCRLLWDFPGTSAETAARARLEQIGMRDENGRLVIRTRKR